MKSPVKHVHKLARHDVSPSQNIGLRLRTFFLGVSLVLLWCNDIPHFAPRIGDCSKLVRHGRDYIGNEHHSAIGIRQVGAWIRYRLG
jgi:hypothetical protein